MTNTALTEFSERLRKACANNPELPREHEGLYSFVAKELGVKPQAARRYFAAEAKPRPKKMEILAKLVNADQAWLALGVGDKSVTHEMRSIQNVIGDYAVNYVYALMGINGYKCILTDGTGGVDAICEKYGTQLKISVTSGLNKSESERIAKVKGSYVQHVNLVVFHNRKELIDVVVVPPELIESLDPSTAGSIEIPMRYVEGRYFVGDQEVFKIQDTNFL